MVNKIKLIAPPERTVTIEQKSTLIDLVGNIVSPILIWLNKFVDAKTQKERKQIVNILAEISKDADRKVKNFKCENHCYPPFKECCNEFNRPID